MDTTYGDDSLTHFAERILTGLGVSTREGNVIYVEYILSEMLTYTTDLLIDNLRKQGKLTSTVHDGSTIHL